MLTLVFVIIIIATILLFCRGTEDSICTGCALICVGLLVCIVVCACDVVEGRTIDEKIAMYEEENENIENDIDILVEQYMDYESDTYGELKGESSITLVSMYPELTSDALVSKQIEVYTDNNEKIKELKESKISLKASKWWLYFGG